MASDRLLVVCTFLVLASASSSSIARAEVSAEARQTARALMDQGHAHRARGEKAEALESFRAADAIMHVPSTGIEVARALADLGRLLEAYETALRVQRLPRAEGEPKPFVEARLDAERMIDELDARIPTLVVRVRGAEGAAEVRVDGVLLPASPPEVPRKLDPGRHVVVASAGGRTANAEVMLAERERRTIVLDVTPPVTAPPVEAPPSPSHALLFAGAAVGGAGLVVGAVAGIEAWRHRNAAQGQCQDDKCPPPVHDDVDAAHTFGNVSTVGFIVAGVGAGLVVFDLVRSSGKPSSHQASVGVAPNAVMLRVQF